MFSSHFFSLLYSIDGEKEEMITTPYLRRAVLNGVVDKLRAQNQDERMRIVLGEMQDEEYLRAFRFSLLMDLFGQTFS